MNIEKRSFAQVYEGSQSSHKQHPFSPKHSHSHPPTQDQIEQAQFDPRSTTPTQIPRTAFDKTLEPGSHRTLLGIPTLPHEIPFSAPSPSKLESGINGASMDRSVRPQDDIYRYSLGRWLDATEIPADRSRWGAYDKLREDTLENIQGIMRELIASGPHPRGSEAQKLVDFYQAALGANDEGQGGIETLQHELDRIDDLQSPSDVLRHMAYNLKLGIGQPFGIFIDQDKDDPDQYLTYIGQSSKQGMPDREYYLNDDPKYVELRSKYIAYVGEILGRAGVKKPERAAQRILALETALASVQWTREQNRDVIATYNKMSLEKATKLTPNIPWKAYLEEAGLGQAKEVVLEQPSYFEALSAFLSSVSPQDWKLFFKFKLMDSFAPYLGPSFNQAHFDFHGKVINGQPEQRSVEKRAIALVNGALRDALGKHYVERYFPPESKARIEAMVENVRAEYADAIEANSWMSEATKEKALEKLAKFTVKIGHPEKWTDYSSLEVRPGDLVGNVMRKRAFSTQEEFSALGKPVDRGQWFMGAQTVNAYFNPGMNEIVFPAARAQPPFFDPKADEAANYGAFATVIGHEFSHGFDDQGRKTDGDGRLVDWWTPEDAQNYVERSRGLVAQFDQYKPLPDLAIDGDLTLGENIGDLAGVTMAARAYKRSLKGKKSALIDGLSGEQRFFVAYAQMRGSKIREEALREQLTSDPHSPGKYRVIGIVRNMPEFYEAFGAGEGDKLYLAPEERVKIW